VLDHFMEVEDFIAVGTKRVNDQDERVLLVPKMKLGILSSNLRHKICSAIRHALSPRHVPAKVLQVQDIPYTVNGKCI
jgi:acetoacetyl-CoA synthetase